MERRDKKEKKRKRPTTKREVKKLREILRAKKSETQRQRRGNYRRPLLSFDIFQRKERVVVTTGERKQIRDS